MKFQKTWLVVALCLKATLASASYNEPAGCSQLPAFTGDLTKTSGSCAGSVASGATLTDTINQEFVVSTANLSKTDSTLATITGLSLALTAGKTYNCRGHLHGVSGATGGVKVSLTSSASLSVTSMSATAMTLNGAALVAAGTVTVTALGTLIGVAAIYTDMYIDAALVVNAGGTLLVQGAQQVTNATATTFLQGATFSCVRVN